jgi:hypothetical protein
MEENNIQENNENLENKVENKEDIKDMNNVEENKNEEDGDKKNEVIDLEETDDEIKKEDINNIVDYLTNLDFEKYSRDMEIREALMVLKTKMDKDQEIKEKEKQIEKDKVTIIEDNNKTENDLHNNQQTLYDAKVINTIEEPKTKEIREIKEPKEIIDEQELKKKEEIEKYKIAEKIAKSDALKDVHSVKSVQKLLMRENIDNQVPLKITVIKENPLASCDDYAPNKLPFLRSLPLV